MGVPKGNIPWNTGIPHSEETKHKISEAHLASGFLPPSQVGYRHTEETKAKIRKALLGNTYSKGKKWTLEARLKITKVKEHLVGGKWRNSVEYRAWRTAIFERDNFTCQLCGTRGGKMQADHIKKWADFPELRLELSNGRTLCVPCHEKTPNYMNRKPIYA